MRRRVFLHAGLHKTGTSSIQVELTRARHLLEERGFLYPRTGCPEWAPFGQHLLPWSLVSKEELIPSVYGRRPSDRPSDRLAVWDALRREIDEAASPNIILSSEEFDILDKQAIEALATQLNDFDITPILFLRNPSDLVESAYRTSVAVSGFQESIDVFVRNNRTRLDYFQLLQDWRSVAHEGRLHIVSYDDEHLRADSVLTFLRIMGLTAEAVESERLERQNESAPAFVVEIGRYLRALGGSEQQSAAWFQAQEQFRFRPGASQRYALLPEETRRELDDTYLRELEAISADEALATSVLGRLVLPISHEQRSIIRTPSDAFIAMGAEIIRE